MQRTGAFLLRQAHGLLAWLAAQRLPVALLRAQAPEMFVLLFFCAIAAQFQDCLAWCGWEMNFAHDTIQLMQTKLVKLEELIMTLRVGAAGADGK